MRGADGVKIAVLRKSRAELILIQAAAHAKRYVSAIELEGMIRIISGSAGVGPRQTTVN